MPLPSLLRIAEHSALKDIELSGAVLDLGGDARSAYHAHIRGTYTVTTVNLDDATRPDVRHDLETPLPFADSSYDHVLLMNVLEHVFDFRQLLREARRVLKPGGTIIILVPFIFPIHPSPRDYWRFTEEALLRECQDAGLGTESSTPLGSGVFAARYVLLDRLLPMPARFISFHTARYIAYALDYLFMRAARRMRKKYDPAHYALGYCVVAERTRQI